MKTLFKLVPCALAIVLAAGCATTSSQPENVKPSERLQSIVVPTDHSAVQPANRNVPDKKSGWEKRHDQFNENAQKGGWEVLFIGDSITHFWETFGKDTFAEYYEPRKTLNLGISGDRTQHVLWRLENGNIDGLNPKLAVLMIGTNNFKDNSAREIMDGITAIVQKLNREMPAMKILVLAIFPRADVDQEYRDKLAQVNAMIPSIADGEVVHFLDINDAFLNEDGELTREVMPDLLHPQQYGYTLWAEAMEPKVKELLGE